MRWLRDQCSSRVGALWVYSFWDSALELRERWLQIDKLEHRKYLYSDAISLYMVRGLRQRKTSSWPMLRSIMLVWSSAPLGSSLIIKNRKTDDLRKMREWNPMRKWVNAKDKKRPPFCGDGSVGPRVFSETTYYVSSRRLRFILTWWNWMNYPRWTKDVSCDGGQRPTKKRFFVKCQMSILVFRLF